MMKKTLLLLGLFLNFVPFVILPSSIVNPNMLNVAKINQTPTPLTVVIPTSTIPAATTNSYQSNPLFINESLDETEDAPQTPTVTPLPQKKNPAPTHTLRPTSTPVTIPPPANPNATSLMILFGLIAVIVVVVGVWLNRSSE